MHVSERVSPGLVWILRVSRNGASGASGLELALRVQDLGSGASGVG